MIFSDQQRTSGSCGIAKVTTLGILQSFNKFETYSPKPVDNVLNSNSRTLFGSHKATAFQIGFVGAKGIYREIVEKDCIFCGLVLKY